MGRPPTRGKVSGLNGFRTQDLPSAFFSVVSLFNLTNVGGTSNVNYSRRSCPKTLVDLDDLELWFSDRARIEAAEQLPTLIRDDILSGGKLFGSFDSSAIREP